MVDAFNQSNSSGQTLGVAMIGGLRYSVLNNADGSQVAFAPPGSVISQMSTLSLPGMSDPGPVYGNSSQAYAINEEGMVTGHYEDAAGVVHGWVYDFGVYRTVDHPGAVATWVQGIDDTGAIMGSYTTDTNYGTNYKFVATPTGFNVSDQTKSLHWEDNGVPYTGPVAGLSDEYIVITSDNINMTATMPNVFMHSGSGQDALAALSGNNVLDGGTGSNFLVGGSGHDQFFVDDRGPSQDIWSTIANFHVGDKAVLWGLNPTDHITWANDQGADGYHGLTGHVVDATSHIEASVTLAGYTRADLTGGHLALSYGHTSDLPGLPGSDYLMLRSV